jgi:hypothetical protein
MNVITFIGLSIVFFYSLTQILNFFGISQEIYGKYLLFYIFIALSVIVLPNNYPTV